MCREGNRHSLRIQVEGLKQQVEAASRDLEEKSVLMQETEASLRSEVRLVIPNSNISSSPLNTAAAPLAMAPKKVALTQTSTNSRNGGHLQPPQNMSNSIKMPVSADYETPLPPPMIVTTGVTAKKPVTRSLTKIQIGEDKVDATPNNAKTTSADEAPSPEKTSDPSPLVRYKSLRDQEGKFSLVMKIC